MFRRLVLAWMWLLLAPVVAGEVVLPFEFVKNQIVLEVFLGDGGPYSMPIDTGVTPSGVDLQLAREAGLLASDDPVGQAGGVGGKPTPIYAATLTGVRIGTLQPPPFDAAAMDFTQLGARLGRPLHGILGYAFLRERVVRIDYPGRTVTFDPVPRQPAAGAYVIPLRFLEDDIIPLLADFRVNGVKIPVSLDTGSSLLLELYPPGAEQAGIEPDPVAARTIAGARGEEEVATGRARALQLGPFTAHEQEVTLSKGSRGGVPQRLGNLGNGFLKRFVITIDYGKQTLWLEPTSANESCTTPR